MVTLGWALILGGIVLSFTPWWRAALVAVALGVALVLYGWNYPTI